MHKSFILVSLLISLMVVSCAPKQSPALTQTVTLTSLATKTTQPPLTVTPSVTPTSVSTSNTVYNISVSPDGEIIATTRALGVEVYNLINGKLIYSYNQDSLEGDHLYSYIAWSPNGSFLATGRPSSGVDIWDTSKWDLLTEVKDPKDKGYEVSGFAWSPDSNQLALGMRDGTTQIWDSKENTWTPQEKCDTGQVFGITWMANHELRIFTNSGIYNAKTCQKVENTEFGMDGCCGYTVLSPNQKNIFLFFDLGGNIIDIQKSEFTFGICCYPTIAWSMDGRYFAAIPGQGNSVTIIDTSDRSSYVYVQPGIQALSWSPDNDLIAFGSYGDNDNVIWNAYTGQILVTLQP